MGYIFIHTFLKWRNLFFIRCRHFTKHFKRTRKQVTQRWKHSRYAAMFSLRSKGRGVQGKGIKTRKSLFLKLGIRHMKNEITPKTLSFTAMVPPKTKATIENDYSLTKLTLHHVQCMRYRIIKKPTGIYLRRTGRKQSEFEGQI